MCYPYIHIHITSYEFSAGTHFNSLLVFRSHRCYFTFVFSFFVCIPLVSSCFPPPPVLGFITNVLFPAPTKYLSRAAFFPSLPSLPLRCTLLAWFFFTTYFRSLIVFHPSHL
ncbi:hypothetical protein F5050DRAFT_1747686 [Lentinula boryana]|uniref:Uncharacterized protein n=1 Tax=Lentinula boryana TaxID=40481 RepID=A0ABQ8QHI2_9AGAR|nr:hypothetical protein F5050DRAFT_1747686 [Lentinula boryana]